MTKKFELRRNETEVRRFKDIYEGVTTDQDQQDPEILKTFYNADEALEELKKYKGNIRKMEGNVGNYYLVAEYYIEENTYNDEGEYVDGGDIWRFAEMEED